MLNDTVAENVRYGSWERADEEVCQVASMLGIEDYVDIESATFKQKVGVRGGELSGGERQRIAIARALLKGGDIVVLDEATSALDSESERVILSNVLQHLSDKTVVLISHRLTVVQNVDELFCIVDGRVVERGRHDELIDRSGHYRRLFEEQLIKSRQDTIEKADD